MPHPQMIDPTRFRDWFWGCGRRCCKCRSIARAWQLAVARIRWKYPELGVEEVARHRRRKPFRGDARGAHLSGTLVILFLPIRNPRPIRPSVTPGQLESVLCHAILPWVSYMLTRSKVIIVTHPFMGWRIVPNFFAQHLAVLCRFFCFILGFSGFCQVFPVLETCLVQK